MVMSIERGYGSLVGRKAGPVKGGGSIEECLFECLLEH